MSGQGQSFTCTDCGKFLRNHEPTMIPSRLGERPICVECACKRGAFTTPKARVPLGGETPEKPNNGNTGGPSSSAPFQKSSDTSRAAAKTLDGTNKAAKDRKKIVEYMQARPDRAFKRTDFIEPLGIVNQALCARLNELETRGWIEKSHKVRGIYNQLVWTYRLTKSAEGRAA